MGRSIRAFIAFDLPEDAKRIAGQVGDDLRRRLGDSAVKWVKPGNLHLTLRFLGNIGEADVERLRALLRDFDGSFAPVDAVWTSLGAFPSPRRAQVIWLAVDEPAGRALADLAGKLESALRHEGFGKADKPFRAHVTLGRVRRGKRIDWEHASAGLTIPGGTFSMNAITLFKSVLTPEGPIYIPLEVARASGRGA